MSYGRNVCVPSNREPGLRLCWPSLLTSTNILPYSGPTVSVPLAICSSLHQLHIALLGSIRVPVFRRPDTPQRPDWTTRMSLLP
jgi:hypothetical protein